MRKRDYFYNFLAGVFVIGFATLLLVGALSFGKRMHAAEGCVEDAGYIAVDADTWTDSPVWTDSHGVDRACVAIDDYYIEIEVSK